MVLGHLHFSGTVIWPNKDPTHYINISGIFGVYIVDGRSNGFTDLRTHLQASSWEPGMNQADKEDLLDLKMNASFNQKIIYILKNSNHVTTQNMNR